ncbi:hypothetical protein Tco_0373949 [Tanacetum coccineum]
MDIPLNNGEDVRGSGNGVNTPSNGSKVSGPVDELLGSYIEGGKKNIHSQDGGLKEGNTVIVGSTSQVVEVNVVPSGMPDATSAPGNDGTLNEVGHEFVLKETPISYANKLSPTPLSKANLQKLDANVPNDADYDVWLPLASVHEGRSSYARILIEIDVCNDFGDNLVMAVPNLERTGYTKEIIRVEHEWKPPRCSTCFIFGHLLDHCPKAPKRVVNKMDKGKGGSSGADDEGFVEVKKKKSSGNGTFSLSNSFEALNVGNSVSEEVETGNKASTSGVQEEGQSSTPLVEKINMFEKQLLEGKCVLVDDDGKPLKKEDSEDKIEYVDNEMASYLASKSSRVGHGTKSLLEQWRETNVNDDYDPYDDDMYEGQDIPENIQSICANLDMKVRARMKK